MISRVCFGRKSSKLTKSKLENIYKMLCEKLKKSIDFEQRMWYYILKERKPKTSREADTATYLNTPKGESFQWVTEFEAEGEAEPIT